MKYRQFTGQKNAQCRWILQFASRHIRHKAAFLRAGRYKECERMTFRNPLSVKNLAWFPYGSNKSTVFLLVISKYCAAPTRLYRTVTVLMCDCKWELEASKFLKYTSACFSLSFEILHRSCMVIFKSC